MGGLPGREPARRAMERLMRPGRREHHLAALPLASAELGVGLEVAQPGGIRTARVGTSGSDEVGALRHARATVSPMGSSTRSSSTSLAYA